MLEGLVSVVIPTYNHQSFVRDTLDSVLSQSYQPIEIIVADDGSSDGTPDIIREFASKYSNIVPILHPVNTGLASNFNRGFSLVKGEFIAWLGGDDLMLPDKLLKQVKALRNRADAVGCCHDAEVFESPSGRVLGLSSELQNGRRGFHEGGVELWFEPGYFMLPSTMMVRSSAVPKHGFDERLRFTNDWLLDVEIFRNGKCLAINETLGRYRRHEKNVTGSEDARNLAFEDALVAFGIVEARYPELSHLCRSLRAAGFLAAAVKAHRSGRGREVTQFIRAAIGQGALLRGIGLLLGLLLFGNYITRVTSLPRRERTRFSTWLSTVALRGHC